MVVKRDYETVSYKTYTTKQSFTVWDYHDLENIQNDLIIEFSTQEWDEIITKLIKKLSNFPDNYLKNQGDSKVQKELTELLCIVTPELILKANAISEKMDSGYRFCLLKGQRFFELDEKIRDLFILGFSCLVGTPTITDKISQTILWPIRPETDGQYTLQNTTFSQRAGEAAYHTDTQYFENPEKYVSLWCISPDKDGGGISGLIDGRKIIEKVANMYGKDVIDTLSYPVYPFRVPSVFTAGGTDLDVEIYYASILNTADTKQPLIRYRKETLDKGINAEKVSLNNSQKHALACLEKVINDTSLEFTYFLKKGDVVFINNHELLHKRTHFDDLTRFLVRVRLNPK